MAIEDEDLGALLDEEGGGETEDEDLEAFDSALETASQIFHARVEKGETTEEPSAAPPVKAKPGSKPPLISLKK